MRAQVLALVILVGSSLAAQAVVHIGLPNDCSDRNALQNMAIDARLTAIQLYFKGLVQNVTDRTRRTCLEAHVLMDDRFAVLNKTLALILSDCLSIDVAADIAVKDLCR
jgi:hypothetical protein